MLCFRMIPFLCVCAFALLTSQKLGWHGIQVNYISNDTCSKNCSQTAPRFYNDEEKFICTIGNKEELDRFRHNYHNMLENAQLRFDAPILTDIRLHRKNSARSLNVTFQLPKDKRGSMLETEYVRAVFFRFESVDESDFRDAVFYSDPQERLFEFHEFRPKSKYDSENPRKINYDCLLGLNDSLPTSVYKITLESAPGYNITYYCTLLGEAILEENWLPVIATSFNDIQRSILVVFEEAILESEDMFPLYDKQLYYIVSLLKDATIIQFKKIELGNHVVKFENLTHGSYNIMVSRCEKWSHRKIRTCHSATSHTVDARAIPKENEEDDNSVYLVSAMTISGTLGLLVVFFAAIFRFISWLKNQRQKFPLMHEQTEEESELAEPLREIEEKKKLESITDVRATTEGSKSKRHGEATVPIEVADELLGIIELDDSINEPSVGGPDSKDGELDVPLTTCLDKRARSKDKMFSAHVNGYNLPHMHNSPDRESNNKEEHCLESLTRPIPVRFYRNDQNRQVISTRADVHRCVHGHHHHLPVANDGDVNVHTNLPKTLTPNGDNIPHTQNCPEHKSRNERELCLESEERPETVGSYRNGACAVRRDVDYGQVISTTGDTHRCVHGHYHHLPVANDDNVDGHINLPMAVTQNGGLFHQTSSNSYRNGACAVRRDIEYRQVISTMGDTHRCVHGPYHHLPVANNDNVDGHTNLPMAVTQNGGLFHQTSSNHYSHHRHSDVGYFHNQS